MESDRACYNSTVRWGWGGVCTIDGCEVEPLIESIATSTASAPALFKQHNHSARQQPLVNRSISQSSTKHTTKKPENPCRMVKLASALAGQP